MIKLALLLIDVIRWAGAIMLRKTEERFMLSTTKMLRNKAKLASIKRAKLVKPSAIGIRDRFREKCSSSLLDCMGLRPMKRFAMALVFSPVGIFLTWLKIKIKCRV